jgi:hypothetical protein
VEFLTRLERVVKPTPESPNKLMLVGHSFGASVVFNAIGQILMARFLLDAEDLTSENGASRHSQSKPGLISGYGDVVVLVNPAIEATRIMPFFSVLNEYSAKKTDLFAPGQPPRLMILSSEGDWATRRTFPTARVLSTLLESYADRELVTPYKATLKLNRRYLDRQTMGNVEQIQTHQPLRETQKWSGKCPPEIRTGCSRQSRSAGPSSGERVSRTPGPGGAGCSEGPRLRSRIGASRHRRTRSGSWR